MPPAPDPANPGPFSVPNFALAQGVTLWQGWPTAVSANAVAVAFGFAAMTGVFFGFALYVYTGASVAAAGLSAAAVFGGAALYGAVTKRDLTGIGAYAWMAIFGIIVASVLNLLLLHSSTFSLLISYVVVVIFTVLTAYSVQRIQRGDIAAAAGTMEKGAVLGAFLLYLDFINIFFALLRIMGNSRR